MSNCIQLLLDLLAITVLVKEGFHQLGRLQRCWIVMTPKLQIGCSEVTSSASIPTDILEQKIQELAAEARRIHAESVTYWAAYAADAFWRRPSPEVWAPVDQVRHLTKSIRAVKSCARSSILIYGSVLPWRVSARSASR